MLIKNQIKVPKIFLICCLFTLQPENKVFKEFVFKRDLSLVLEAEYIINKPELVDLIKNFLIKPLIIRKNTAKFKDEITFLKYYLKRFKYFYCKYGAQEIGNCNTQFTVKEINFYAVLSLAIILGI